MKKIYLTLAAALIGCVSSFASNNVVAESVMTYDATTQVPAAGTPVAVDPINFTGSPIQSPARATMLNPYDLSGHYLNMFKNAEVAAIKNMSACENITITQDGNNVYFDGIGGMGEAALAESDQYYFIAPIKGTIDPETGKIYVTGGKKVAGIKGAEDSTLPYLVAFPTSNPGYITVTNGTSQWAHVEGDKIIWDVAGILYCPCGGDFGSGVPVSNGPVSSVFYCETTPCNGVLSFTSTVSGTSTDYTAPAWYEYVKKTDGIWLRMSGVVLDKTNSFVTEWKLDETTDYAVAENQSAWYDVTNASMYTLCARTNRGQYVTTVPASVAERQNIQWPVKYGTSSYTSWVVKNSTGNYFGLNTNTTLRGNWYGNYPPLYRISDENDWYPNTPIEVEAVDGIYSFDLPEDIVEFSISTVKGTSDIDMEGFGRGAYSIVGSADLVEGYVYDLEINPKGYVSVPAAAGVRTVHVDLDLLRIWVTVETPQPDQVEIYFDNGNKHWTNPYVVYSLDNTETWEAPVAMSPTLTLDAPARVLSFESEETEELWVANIPATATHVKFTDGAAEETPVFEAGSDEPYKDSTTSSIRKIEAAGNAQDAVYYNLQGIRVASPRNGECYIEVRGGQTTKVVK